MPGGTGSSVRRVDETRQRIVSFLSFIREEREKRERLKSNRMSKKILQANRHLLYWGVALPQLVGVCLLSLRKDLQYASPGRAGVLFRPSLTWARCTVCLRPHGRVPRTDGGSGFWREWLGRPDTSASFCFSCPGVARRRTSSVRTTGEWNRGRARSERPQLPIPRVSLTYF